MTLQEFVMAGKKRIEASHLQCADPMLHLQQIVGAGLKMELVGVRTRLQESLTVQELEKLNTLLERRLTGEPFQYIVGYEGFWKSTFEVGRGVLIPRRETEHVVEALLELPNALALKVGELGPGSGNIGISALQERPNWEWHGFEINPDSIPYLGRNVGKLLALDAKYQIHEGNFFQLASALAPFDVVVSNPPYIAAPAVEGLSLEVKQEPRLALVGGEKGTEILSHLISAAYALLKPGGMVLSEIGCEQESFVRKSLVEAGFKNVEVQKDLSGLARVAKGVK